MSKKLKNLKDLLEHELQDLYSAEMQLTKALPKMADAAKSEKLKTAFKSHLEETKNQVNRLEQVANEIGIDLNGEECKAMKGLVKEGQEMIKEKAEESVHDAGLIASAQRVEHYEIAGYGTVLSYLEMLKFDKAKDLLGETLKEEKAANEKLTKIAEEINATAIA